VKTLLDSIGNAEFRDRADGLMQGEMASILQRTVWHWPRRRTEDSKHKIEKVVLPEWRAD